MTFSYIGSLFREKASCECPCDVESLISSYVHEVKVVDKARNLFKEVNNLLNLAPTVDEVQRWRKEAKKMRKHVLNQKIYDLTNDEFDDDWYRIGYRFRPDGPETRGKKGPFKKTLAIQYMNMMMYKNVWDKYEKLKADKVPSLSDEMPWAGRWRLTILAPSGNMRVYSRHPIISNSARRHLDDPNDCRSAVADMVKSYYANNHYDYTFCQGDCIFYLLTDEGKYKR